VPAAKQLAEKVGSTATLGCARLAKWQKTEHRQECLCYKNASEMGFFRKLQSRIDFPAFNGTAKAVRYKTWRYHADF
jgi:hypothetical protein